MIIILKFLILESVFEINSNDSLYKTITTVKESNEISSLIFKLY